MRHPSRMMIGGLGRCCSSRRLPRRACWPSPGRLAGCRRRDARRHRGRARAAARRRRRQRRAGRRHDGAALDRAERRSRRPPACCSTPARRPNALTRVGRYTPLHLASSRGHAAVVARLLEAGSKPDARDRRPACSRCTSPPRPATPTRQGAARSRRQRQRARRDARPHGARSSPRRKTASTR